MMKKLLKNQRGLTLVELLAVIVILGIIAAIAVPSIGNVIDNTEDKATVSEAIQIINAAKIAKAESPSLTTFDETSLSSYLDNVKDDAYDVIYNTTTGVYSISDHPAVPLANTTSGATSATETQLIEYTN